MVKAKIDVGNEVEALCTKCKGPSIHVIEVIKNDKITKVLCKSCLSSHKYVSPDTPKKTPVKRTKKAETVPKTKEQRKWARLLNKVDVENAVDYKMESTYSDMIAIKHAKFGLGVVLEVVNPTKVSVIFEDGIRNMVQNRS